MEEWFAWQSGWHGLQDCQDGRQDGMVYVALRMAWLRGRQDGMVCMAVRMAWLTWQSEWHGLHDSQDGMVYMADRMAFR